MRIIVLSTLLAVSAFGQGWTDLTGTHLSSVCPPTGLSVPGNCANVVATWSGGVWDSLRNRLVIWGGGHGDYYGNEVYALYLAAPLPSNATCSNAAAPALCRLNNPSPPANPTTCVATLSDGAANSRHSYDSLAYLSSVDKMLIFGGGVAGNGCGFTVLDTQTLDFPGLASSPTTNHWTRQDPLNETVGKQPSSYYWSGPPILTYDPSTDTTYLMEASGNNLWSYKYSTNTYVQLNNNAAVRSGSTGVLYPPTHTIYYIGGDDASGTMAATTTGPGIYSLSLASGTNWTPANITASTTGCGGLAGATHPGLAYDSKTQQIVGWPNFGNTVYIFDPTTNTCTAQTFPGGPPDSLDYHGNQLTTGTFGRFQYVPSLDAFVVVNSATTDAYLLLLGAGTVTGTGSPSIPTISSFTSAPTSVTAGNSVTLSWTTSGATSVFISPTVGSVALSGTATVVPAASTTYTLTATNTTGSVTATVPLTITTSSAPTITSFTATPASIASGQASTLSWVAIGATSIAISPGAFTAASASGTTSVSPATTSTYTLTATNTSGSATAQTTVTVGFPAPTSSSTPDTFTITNAGATVSNYPVELGRPFALGEFPNGQLPQAFLGSTPLPTQVDVKSRWPDNSLKHAILSFLIPTFTAGQAYPITLTAGSTVGNTPVTQAQMLAAPFNFDAQLHLTNGGTTKTASARTMLTNGDYTIWASGPVATTIILANHGQSAICGGRAASKYDFGFDAYCAFRPEFEATFWPTTNQVFVRYIGEIGDTEQLENVVVNNLVLTLGNSSPVTVYTLPSNLSPLTMGALTRWTLSYWLNGTPPAAGYNHNLAYLESTKIIPNFDTHRVIPASQIAGAYATWQGLATADPYDAADLTELMGNAGSRNYPADEIGPLTGPEVMWIYSGDYRAQQMAIRYAELAGAWPIHWREGKAGKWFDRAHTIGGVGHWMNSSGRPSYCIECGSTYFSYNSIASADQVTPVGSTAYGCVAGGSTGWCPSVSHEPDWTPVYLLTGDHYFLEEDWAWESYSTLAINGGPTYTGRGPTGMEGAFPAGPNVYPPQIRGAGWELRNRVEVAAISPDSSPEQSYFDLLVKDVLAAWEGEREITTGAYNGNKMWIWGNQWGNKDATTGGCYLWCGYSTINGVNLGVPTAIHFWAPDTNGNVDYPISSGFTGDGTAPWMVQYLIYSLGRAKDVGYPSNALLAWIAPWIINQVTDPAFNPYLVASYREATVQPNGQYYTTWGSLLTSICTSAATGCVAGGTSSNAQTYQGWDRPNNRYGAGCALDPNGDGDCSSAYEAGMAIAQVADQAGGGAAWSWINTNAMQSAALNSNPKWDVIPRNAASTIITTANSCDLNGDGVVNGADVTLAINQALGTLPCTTANLQNNGQCTVVDVQRVINASLGQACKTGN